ncbi:hypothetical protein P4377_24930 [Bacillus thuringiensis]|nr:hypothetical protein [Bacillus thuringiensis]
MLQGILVVFSLSAPTLSALIFSVTITNTPDKFLAAFILTNGPGVKIITVIFGKEIAQVVVTLT